jgi:hypothetical protein
LAAVSRIGDVIFDAISTSSAALIRHGSMRGGQPAKPQAAEMAKGVIHNRPSND